MVAARDSHSHYYNVMTRQFFFHSKGYTSITLYKHVARGPQETIRVVQGGPLVTTILSNRSIATHNNGGYKSIIDIIKDKKLSF